VDTANNPVLAIRKLNATLDALIKAVADSRTRNRDGMPAITEAAVAHLRALADLIGALVDESNDLSTD
jgi:hypothetical protein